MSEKNVEYKLTPKGEELSKQLEQKNSDALVEQQKIKEQLKDLKDSLKNNDQANEPTEDIDDDSKINKKDGLNYQQAAKIRKKSFGTLLGEQEGGLFTSFKKALSIKTKANVKGFKEKIDPLNIAKFLTGGSNLAPAVLGKLRGRSKEDIAHFTGGKVSQSGDTATKLSPLESENNMLDILMKIYTFMQKTQEDDTKRREEAKQFEEEVKTEKDRRHKDLIEALTGKRPENATAEKVEKDTGMDTPSILSSILDSFGGAKTALSLLRTVGTFFMGPVGLAFLGAASLGAIFYAMSQASDESHAEATKVSGAMDASSEGAAITNVIENTDEIERRKQNILAGRPSSKKSMLPWKDPVLQEQFLKEIGWDNNTGLTEEEKKVGFVGIDQNGIPIKKEEQSQPAATPPSTSAPTSTESSSAPTSSSTSTASESSGSSSTPVVETPAAGAKLAAVQSTNNDLNIPEAKSVATTITNSVTNVNKVPGEPKRPIPMVRNQEETFQRMIMNSTRVV
jgi:hypothetical protein